MVEGEKSVVELINSDLIVNDIFATKEWIDSNPLSIDQTITEATKTDLERMSFFKSASPIIAVSNQKKNQEIDLSQNWFIALDGISDPGNLGTIIRIADWYGISTILCSNTTVDLYNPKTISSTMGSFTRVSVHYGELSQLVKSSNKTLYCTLMDGESLYEQKNLGSGIIIIGSEANGISESILNLPHTAITIPRLGKAESLNAAVATGIICDRLTQ